MTDRLSRLSGMYADSFNDDPKPPKAAPTKDAGPSKKSTKVAPPAASTSAAKQKMSFYAAPEIAGRIRAAAPHAMAAGRFRTASDWYASVIVEAVEKLERDLNNGEPWEPAEPGEVLSPGRPRSW